MARVSDGTDVPVSPLQASSSNMGSLPDFDGTGFRACTMEEKINEMFVQVAKLPLLMQNISRFENFVQTLSHTVASYDAKITNIEQIVSSLAARVTTLETNATSVSSGSGSARSWNILGHFDGSSATGSLGSHSLVSSVDNRNTRRGLDTFSSLEDEHARSAVLLRFPCAQYQTGITNWINCVWEKSNMPAYHKPVRIHCKAGSLPARLVFETRAKCQDLVVRYKDDGIPYEIDSPFCSVKTTIAVRQSRSIEDREVGKQFAPLWRVLAEQLKVLFPESGGAGALIVLRSTSVYRFSASRIVETVSENQCSNLLPLGNGQVFALTANDWHAHGIPDSNVLKKRSISEVLSDHSLSSRLRNHLRFLVPAISLALHHEVT